MSAQIVFLTAFLGIVAGVHPVNLEVSGPIKTVRMMLGEREVAVLTQPPWRATIEMGRTLVPRELTAIGFDAQGKEIARTTQILNLPRPVAEFDILLEQNAGQAPAGLTLRWSHLVGSRPTKAKVALDGKPLALDRKLHARLPKLDLETPHVISAELRFDDGFVTRRELVIESVRSDTVGTQLTPIMVRETAAQHPASWDGCLVGPSGRAVRTAAMETPRAVVIVVRDPNHDFRLPRGELPSLDKGTVLRMLWPVGRRYDADPKNPASFLFPPSSDVNVEKTSFPRFLSALGPVLISNEPLQLADAVAAAGVQAATGVQRRAVVVILTRKPDESMNAPREVRRYLASIGVPLFVWSPTAPPPPRAQAWGEFDDVSTTEKLGQAIERLRHTLAEQRIAWVDVDPLTALRLKANESCGIETSARVEP